MYIVNLRKYFLICLPIVGKRGERLLLSSSARAVLAMACVNYSLQSCFFQKDIHGELIVFGPLNIYFTILSNVILRDLSKFSFTFKIGT